MSVEFWYLTVHLQFQIYETYQQGNTQSVNKWPRGNNSLEICKLNASFEICTSTLKAYVYFTYYFDIAFKMIKTRQKS